MNLRRPASSLGPVLVLAVGLLAASCTSSADRVPTTTSSTSAPTFTTGHPPAPPATAHPAPTPTTSAPTTTTTSPPPPAPADPVLVEPNDGYGPVDAFIAGARHRVDMTMYELADPTAEAALTADAARGVDVRVLLDADDEGASVNGPASQALAAGGVHVAWSYRGEIFHQKTITVDGATSLIMTGNLTAQYYATTRDFAVYDTDATDVAAIETTFTADFAGGSPAPAPPADYLLWSPNSEAALVALIGSAQHTLVAESEEMDSAAIAGALETDAQRGVDVDVVMTDSSSWSSAFARLQAAGVHVLVYEGESPLYIHAKVVLVDAGLTDQQVFVGSQNFSTASMVYNRELGVITTVPAYVNPIASTLAGDVAGATPWS